MKKRREKKKERKIEIGSFMLLMRTRRTKATYTCSATHRTTQLKRHRIIRKIMEEERRKKKLSIFHKKHKRKCAHRTKSPMFFSFSLSLSTSFDHE